MPEIPSGKSGEPEPLVHSVQQVPEIPHGKSGDLSDEEPDAPQDFVPPQHHEQLQMSQQTSLATPKPPIASSRELWHFAVKCRLARCNDILSFGELLLFGIQTLPARVSLFERTYPSFAIPFRDKFGCISPPLKDLLPFPLPALESYVRW